MSVANDTPDLDDVVDIPDPVARLQAQHEAHLAYRRSRPPYEFEPLVMLVRQVDNVERAAERASADLHSFVDLVEEGGTEELWRTWNDLESYVDGELVSVVEDTLAELAVHIDVLRSFFHHDD